MVFIVSEIGVNHNGSVSLAMELVQESVDAGADAVKFQSFTAEDLASPETPKVGYQYRESSDSHVEMLARLQLNEQDHFDIAEFASSQGIEFLSTPYSVPMLNLLTEIGVTRIKTASADIVDLPLHEAIADTGLPVMIATGMASDAEILEVSSVYEASSCDVTLMHAVSKYPTPLEEANLLRIAYLRDMFGLPVGYSDHTEGIEAAVAAIALGAEIVEKHLTLDPLAEGPDHFASATPRTFREMVLKVRRIEEGLGDGTALLQPEEIEMSRVSRKSLHAKHDINVNQTIAEGDLMLRRPGTGLTWANRHKVVGCRATKHIPVGQMLSLVDLA